MDCPRREDMEKIVEALKTCAGFNPDDRAEALYGVKSKVCGFQCSTVCDNWTDEFMEENENG